jgi:hypothetical protein
MYKCVCDLYPPPLRAVTPNPDKFNIYIYIYIYIYMYKFVCVCLCVCVCVCVCVSIKACIDSLFGGCFIACAMHALLAPKHGIALTKGQHAVLSSRHLLAWTCVPTCYHLPQSLRIPGSAVLVPVVSRSPSLLYPLSLPPRKRPRARIKAWPFLRAPVCCGTLR